VWKFLAQSKVNYLTIGGFAVNVYGFGRNTGDIDIFIEDTLENRKNLQSALLNLGIEDCSTILTMQFIPGWTDFPLRFGFRLDVLTTVKGLEDLTFSELITSATVVNIEDVDVYFLDYKNLIKSKRASSRPKDILDIEELEKINNRNFSKNCQP
jgi:hypothetical protein